MIKNFIKKSKEKRFIEHYKDTLVYFIQNTERYLWYSKNLHYPYNKHRDGRPLVDYEKLVIEVMNHTEKIIAINDEDSLSFFANTLYSETILMDKVNQAIDKNVPMDHEVIKDSINEILDGQKSAFIQYCNINTILLKEEVFITKTLRIRQEEARNELKKRIND